MKNSELNVANNSIIKNFIFQAFSLRFYYLICLVLFGSIAFFINQYSPKIYEVSASISPLQQNPTNLVKSDYFSANSQENSPEKIENELTNLLSFSLVATTISNLNMEVGYFMEQRKFIDETHEIYDRSPFTVKLDKSHIQPIDTKFYIKILSDSTYRLTVSEPNASVYNYVDNEVVGENIPLMVDTVYRFNETLTSKYFKFSVSQNKDYFFVNNDPKLNYYFICYHLDFLTKLYLGSLKAELVSPLGTIIQIYFRGENIDENIDFLNSYINSYLAAKLDKKNMVAISTIKFIDSQISEISDSLTQSESKLRNYRSANQVMDLSYQGQKAFDQLGQIETERSNLQVQQRYYNYILNYFDKNKDMSGLVPPSAMNVNDDIMNKLITDLLALNTERSGILNNNNEKNLFLNQIENKIMVQKRSIIEYVTNNLNTLTLSLNELNYRSDKVSKEISKLPKTELNLVGIQRKFSLNNDMYTFLLQKRSEAAITMASNHPDYEISEPAREITSRVVRPKKSFNLMISIFLALLIPTAFLFIKEFFNEKIRSVNEIVEISNQMVLGVIFSNKHSTEYVVAKYPGSPISEAFRAIRGKLFIKLKDISPKIILITSTQPGDGKSFFSLNLASSIAAVGNKTVLIDCDLRRPTLHTKLKKENDKGISTCMIDNLEIEKVIQQTELEMLSFISAGPIPPNPAELIESGILGGFIETLKKSYEYIIIDTTPVGFFADASLLMKFASQIIIVTRNNYTKRDNLIHTLNNIEAINIKDFEIVFNDISFKKSNFVGYKNYYLKDKEIIS